MFVKNNALTALIAGQFLSLSGFPLRWADVTEAFGTYKAVQELAGSWLSGNEGQGDLFILVWTSKNKL